MKWLLFIFLISVSEARFEDVGRTFKYAGPNCFGVSLYGAGLYPHLRGVGAREFSGFVARNCHPVHEPKATDLGIYSSPQGLPVHAVAQYQEGYVYEKQGVDYMGATPIQVSSFTTMNYRVEATSLCRRFGDETCFNQLRWVRCKSRNTKSELLLNLEQALEEILKGEAEPNSASLRNLLAQIKREGLVSFEEIKSLEFQLEFIL